MQITSDEAFAKTRLSGCEEMQARKARHQKGRKEIVGTTKEDPEELKEELAQRIRENLPKTEKIKKLDELEDNIIFDTSGSASDIQLNKSRDFGTMSKNELRQATDVIRNLSIHLPQKPYRRFQPRKMGQQLSVRLGLKEGAKSLGIVLPKFMRKKEKGRPIIFLIDISGSMENYSKMLMISIISIASVLVTFF